MSAHHPTTGRWFALLCLVLLSAGAAAADYPKTIEALQERYADEVQAHLKYNAYAKQALKEGYPNIAHLFRALAASEAVHARNFAALLKKLGTTPGTPKIAFQITSTRKHLQQATEVEADEIDKEYPAILARIEPEGYRPAIQSITWAWQAEKQHRELIIKIRDAATSWFGLLVNRIEGEPSHYYVCQICGSTLDQRPAQTCPICGHPAENYQEVPWEPGAPRKEEPSLFFND
jgi:rubrerythrin